MRNAFQTWLAIAFTLTSCSTVKKTGDNPGVSAPDLNVMVVVKPNGRFKPGDTIRADLSSISFDNKVLYDEGGGRWGTIALDALGPSVGTMVVAADRLNVRRCRSTGCSVAGRLRRGQKVQVRDFAGRWYRMTVDGKPAGYVRVDYLLLPVVYRRRFVE